MEIKKERKKESKKERKKQRNRQTKTKGNRRNNMIRVKREERGTKPTQKKELKKEIYEIEDESERR